MTGSETGYPASCSRYFLYNDSSPVSPDIACQTDRLTGEFRHGYSPGVRIVVARIGGRRATEQPTDFGCWVPLLVGLSARASPSFDRRLDAKPKAARLDRYWLALHETASPQRAYRKEAERLILWAIVERGRALSSLTTDDAIAYRAFVRRPAPRERWIGPPRPRDSVEWRPFSGGLSARSSAYARKHSISTVA